MESTDEVLFDNIYNGIGKSDDWNQNSCFYAGITYLELLRI